MGIVTVFGVDLGSGSAPLCQSTLNGLREGGWAGRVTIQKVIGAGCAEACLRIPVPLLDAKEKLSSDIRTRTLPTQTT